MNSNLKCGRVLGLAGLLGTLLAACGGGSTQGGVAESRSNPVEAVSQDSAASENGVSPLALPADFGLPQSAANMEAMVKTLGPYFGHGGALRAEAQLGAAKGLAMPKAAPYPKPVFRFLNGRTGTHFYTITESERDHILANFPWFNPEGTGFYAQQGPASGLSPVYRFDNLVTGTHFYTISEAEKNKVVADYPAIFRLSGPGLWASASPAPGWLPMHRFFNRATGTHFYTANETERQSVVANIPAMQYDGIGYYVRANDDPALAGVVAVNGPVRNAVVCLDLNLSNACDVSEPRSARTGANGVYDISFFRSTVSEAAQAAAPLLAMMVPGPANNPDTTLDIDLGLGDGPQVTGVGFVMRQVPGRTGPINPLTTLVAAGVAGGMSEAAARSNVAIQLAITEAKIDNYQDDPVLNSAAPLDSARLMAHVVAGALDDGVPLRVGLQTASVDAALGSLRTLRYTDASNYDYLEFYTLAKVQGNLGQTVSDLRQGLTAAVPITDDYLYNQAYLAPGGWIRCSSAVPLTATLGTPSRATFCNAQLSVGYRNNTDIAGRTMASVVSDLQAMAGNPINAGQSNAGLMTALGGTTFSAGSALLPGYTLNLNQPVFLNSINTDGRREGVGATLEVMIAEHPAADANAALPDVGASLSLGLGSGNLRNLRVSFTGSNSANAGTVQFYECDLDATLTVVNNCVATQTGAYAITAINGDRIMSFNGHGPTVMNHERLYAEVSENNRESDVIGGTDYVFLARRQKLGLVYNVSENTRLNGTAWGAMKSQLGL